MPLGNVWAWPSRLGYERTLNGMKRIADSAAELYATDAGGGHPVAIGRRTEQKLIDRWHSVVVVDMPNELPVLVANSPFDAALHDAYGKAHGRSVYHCYGRDFLGDGSLEGVVTADPLPRMPLYHLVGAVDPLTAADVVAPVGDGLPEALTEWIRADGLTHLKIKLNGDDLGWDVDRVLRVNAVADECRPGGAWHFSLDFNERCQSVAYLLECLNTVRAKSPAAHDRIQYVEQPTHRDLKAHPDNRMHEASKLKPVVIDESLTDLESLHLAREMGYTGVAFKACKGQTQTLLLAAEAQKLGLFRCVQDLTCPGASLIHSAGLAAHIPGVAAIEANGRQYVPAANAGWTERFPGLFTTTDGFLHTGQLTGVGLGAG
jgi:L-alanine-DL-glutamate epimerase-like enolase superfamily enzyme